LLLVACLAAAVCFGFAFYFTTTVEARTATAVMLGAAAATAWHQAGRLVRRQLRRLRISEGRCAACGYDLQGAAGPCPACATAKA
jgi:hypothetical protein